MTKQDKTDLWINGLVFAYEFVNGIRWIPIGWDQISKYVQKIQVPYHSASQSKDPMWWCHVNGGHQYIKEWLSAATWLDSRAIIALREQGQKISNYMEQLGYELPVTVGGGLLLELLEHSVPDMKCIGETSVKLRCFHAQNFLVSSQHINSSPANGRVLSIIEVQELLSAGGGQVPKSIHEIIAHLLARFSCWDDRLFRRHIFEVSYNTELEFMQWRCNKALKEAMCIVFDTKITNLSKQVLKLRNVLNARESIIFELLHHMKGTAARILLTEISKSTREIMEEQEQVRDRLFNIQDVMDGIVRSCYQEKSLYIAHYLAILGGVGLILSLFTGLFGMNVDGIPGAKNSPNGFAIYVGVFFLLGLVLTVLVLRWLGLKRPLTEDNASLKLRKMGKRSMVQDKICSQPDFIIQ